MIQIQEFLFPLKQRNLKKVLNKYKVGFFVIVIRNKAQLTDQNLIVATNHNFKLL